VHRQEEPEARVDLLQLEGRAASLNRDEMGMREGKGGEEDAVALL
jgi:hypothetical protein